MGKPYRDKKNDRPRIAVGHWIVVLIYMGLIYYLSSQSTLNIKMFPEHSDKILHMLIYTPLAFLIALALIKSGAKRYVFITAMVMTTLFGISDEFHQSFVPGRVPEVDDVLADTVGALLGSFGASILKG